MDILLVVALGVLMAFGLSLVLAIYYFGALEILEKLSSRKDEGHAKPDD